MEHSLVQHSFNGHHSCLRDLAMLSLFPDRPRSCFSCKPFPVSTHKTPGAIDELSNYICWACIEVLLCNCKGFFWNLAIVVLHPSPVLESEFDHLSTQYTTYHFNGLSSQWNLGKKMHLCPASLIVVSSIHKVFLFTEQACHATISIFEWAYR